MGDLSKHLGPGGEFALGLIGLLAILSLHQPFRRALVGLAARLGARSSRGVRFLERNSLIFHGWMKALGKVARDRRFTLLIAVYLFFEIVYGVFRGAAARMLLEPPAFGAASELAGAQFAAHLEALYSLAGAYFAWIAFRLASGEDLDGATQLKPLGRLAATAAFFFCTDLAARNFPPPGAWGHLVSDAEYLQSAAFWAGTPFFLALLAGGALVMRRIVESFDALLSAIAGLFVFGWIHELAFAGLRTARWTIRDGPRWAYQLAEFLGQVAYTLAGAIIFLAFAASLAPGTFVRRGPATA